MIKRPNSGKYKEKPIDLLCIKCNQVKPFTSEHFYPHSGRKYKLSYVCKICDDARKTSQNLLRRVEINKVKRSWAKNNKLSGLCVKCNTPLLATSNNYCEKHYYQDLSHKSLGTKKEWLYLKTLLESQNFKCKYSGIDLVLGINASIDHIKPKATNPELYHNKDNIVWVDIKINRMKREHNLDEFVELCKLVSKTAPTPA